MPRKRIYTAPLTGAERQARHRQRNVTRKLETSEETDKRRWNLQAELCKHIEKLDLVQLYAIKPLLLYFTDDRVSKPENMEKLCDLINGMVDFELSDPGDPEDNEED